MASRETSTPTSGAAAAGGDRPPLDGLRVLDFTTFLSGPYGTQMLADLGADIIKVESPVGDLSRSIAPHFVAGDSLYFHTINRNKRSITVDLKHPEAPALVRELIAQCDVVYENFRPGVMTRLGLDAEELLAEHPSLIWCSISGFGQTGPYRSLQAYDMVVQAMSGSMSFTGEPGGAPVRTGIPLGDLTAGLHGNIAILAALNRRNVTGRGEIIDISMLDCVISMLSYQGTYFLQSGQQPEPQGRGHDSIPTYRGFTAGDGRDVVITANTEQMWRSLCETLGTQELLADPRFTENADRLRNREALWAVLEPAFLREPADVWLKRFNESGVPAALVNTFDDVFTDEHVLHREMVLELADDGTGETVRVPGRPIKLHEAPLPEPTFPPGLGADTAEVLESVLDVDRARIDAWRELGLFGGSDQAG
jgi:CoA:oxalate CoA-transferase